MHIAESGSSLAGFTRTVIQSFLAVVGAALGRSPLGCRGTRGVMASCQWHPRWLCAIMIRYPHLFDVFVLGFMYQVSLAVEQSGNAHDLKFASFWRSQPVFLFMLWLQCMFHASSGS